MSLFDAFLGRTRMPKPQLDPLFTLSTAGPDLIDRGLVFAHRAGLCLRGREGSGYARVLKDAEDLLTLYSREHDMVVSRSRDNMNFHWFALEGGELEDAITAVHVVGDTLQEQGFAEDLLAAVFRFTHQEEQRAYLVYNYKRGLFYPFAPTGSESRDNPRELHLSALVDRVRIPVEKETERWYALWDLPV